MLLVTLSVSSRATGAVLLKTSSGATAVRYQVGDDCGPWCTNAYMSLDDTSGLLIEPSPTDSPSAG